MSIPPGNYSESRCRPGHVYQLQNQLIHHYDLQINKKDLLVKFPLSGLLKSHGCVTDLWGPGINQGTLSFKGRFDGTRFTAEAKFMAAVIDNCPDLFSYNGDVHWIFAYDMAVVCN